MNLNLLPLLFVAALASGAPVALAAAVSPAPSTPNTSVPAKPVSVNAAPRASSAELAALEELGASNPELLRQSAGDEIVLEEDRPHRHWHDGYGYGIGIGGVVLVALLVLLLLR